VSKVIYANQLKDMKNTTFYRAVVDSKEWQDWEEYAYKKGFDWSESTESGWLSKEHFSAFLKWYKKR